MSVNIVAGEGQALDTACALADECELQYVRIELSSTDRYNFDLAPLVVYSPAETKIFVALDQRAVNYARHKLIAEVRLSGYRSFNLISPRAIVGQGSSFKGNVYIGAGSNVGAGCVIGVGGWLERQVVLGDNVKLGSCTTVLAGAFVGDAAQIAVGSTLGGGVRVSPGIKVGRHCEWLLPESIKSDLPDRSFYDEILTTGARVIN